MRLFVISLVLAVAAPAAERAAAQSASAQALGRANILEATRTIIGKARYATLVTLDERGVPHARIVDPFAPEDELTIWIGTNSRSRKVAQIARDRRVALTYFDRDAQHYVTVSGTATVIRDLKARAARWKSEWKPFYENEYRGDDYVLLRIEPLSVEVVAPDLGLNNDPATWRPVILDLRARP